jgi:hypothetical protein
MKTYPKTILGQPPRAYAIENIKTGPDTTHGSTSIIG